MLLSAAFLWGCKKETTGKSLQLQYQEIKKMAANEACTNASAWRITPIGAKACGGPAAYIAYSSKIDTAAFLQKVAEYTKAQKKYNKESGAVSDCAVLLHPGGIDCLRGKPVFIY